MKNRISIPKEVQRKLLVECGHQCSIPGCFQRSNLWFHHINFSPNDNKESNVIVLCPNHAAMADRGEIDRKACKEYKKRLKQQGPARAPVEPLEEIVKREGIYEPPESLLEKSLTYFGRKYLIWRYGRLDASLRNEIVLLFLIATSCFIPIFYVMFLIYEGIVMNTTSLILSICIMCLGLLLFSGYFFLESRKCPNCNRYFGKRRIDRRKVSEKELYKTEDGIKIERIYRSTYECEFCKNQETRNESVTEWISNE